MSSSDEESYARNRSRTAELEQRRARIRELNDRLRQQHVGGMITLTRGVKCLGDTLVNEILGALGNATSFTPGDDPHEEHDFGALEIAGQRILWKIDYYDKQLEFGSSDAADPDVTARVLTIMLASEY